MYQSDLLKNETVYQKYLPIINTITQGEPTINDWDIPFTIKELSYLVHSHYRYYGKFPSVVAGQILEQFPPSSPDHYVLDNFCGSGTTLVEAKLRGIKAFGTDISWLSVLASNVKINSVDTNDVKRSLLELVKWFEEQRTRFTAPDDTFSQKWFEETAARDLFVIQNYLFEMKDSRVKDFLIIAFLGIVRRVSKAHDGEVRPHIKKDKKQRIVISAFSKKTTDMCKDHDAFQNIIVEHAEAKCLLVDNLSLPRIFDDGNCYLAISHPPLLK